jgi:RNA polymerase sigma-70 factor (ECF subfamily)
MEKPQADWTNWFNCHGPRLLLFARQWGGGHAEAQDIMQEASVRFWQVRDRARAPAAYMYACVRKCALESRRSGRRRERREQAAIRERPAYVEAAFEVLPEKDEFRRSVEAALERLPEEQRQVLVLKIWGELTLEQIGQVMEVSPNTAASRFRYGLTALRRELKEWAP